MSSEADTSGFKMVAIVFVLFCVSGFKSCEELRYMTSARTCETTVSKITENTSSVKTGRRHIGYSIWYSFQNENTGKTVQSNFSTGLDGASKYSIGQPLTIEYIGNDMISSRPRGSRNWFWVGLFFLMLTALAVSTVWLVRHVSAKTAKLQRRR